MNFLSTYSYNKGARLLLNFYFYVLVYPLEKIFIFVTN